MSKRSASTPSKKTPRKLAAQKKKPKSKRRSLGVSKGEALPVRASDSAEDLADWLEWTALKSADRNSSFQDLVQELRRNGTTDAVQQLGGLPDRDDSGGEKSESVAEAAFEMLDERSRMCGPSPGGYPFEVKNGFIQLRSADETSIYTFLLCLTRFGLPRAPGIERPDVLFEDVSRTAAEGYLGGPSDPVGTYPFGFPRRRKPKHFPAAVDDLCKLMGEGTNNQKRPNTDDQKDAKLDLVVWRSFADGRIGKLIAFGQCATGEDWRDKVGELNPRAFLDQWISGDVPVKPLKLFFVPRHIEERDWLGTALNAGIIFDRCRIVNLSRQLDTKTASDCAAWTKWVLTNKVRV